MSAIIEMKASKTEDSYNGWTNYETWNWKLWIDNDQANQEYWLEQAKQVFKEAEPEYEWESYKDAAIRILADQLQYDADEMAEHWMNDQSGPFSDILNAGIGRIDWRDIAESLIDDAEELS